MKSGINPEMHLAKNLFGKIDEKFSIFLKHLIAPCISPRFHRYAPCIFATSRIPLSYEYALKVFPARFKSGNICLPSNFTRCKINNFNSMIPISNQIISSIGPSRDFIHVSRRKHHICSCINQEKCCLTYNNANEEAEMDFRSSLDILTTYSKYD